ncbi:MAG: hypothetical protein GY884_24390, partial [Proteobacteria bacterium]|nr:hypothetical protein [Pseudomonadota bacterium]
MTLVDALHAIGDPAGEPAVRNASAGVLKTELQLLGARIWSRSPPEVVDEAAQTVLVRLWTKPYRILATTDGQARAYLRTGLTRQMATRLKRRGRDVSYDDLLLDTATGHLGADVLLDAHRAAAEDLETVIDAALARTQDAAKWFGLLVEIRKLSTEGVRLIDVVRAEQTAAGKDSYDEIRRAENRRRTHQTRARKYVHRHLDGYPHATERERELVDDLRRRFDDVYRFNKAPKT